MQVSITFNPHDPIYLQLADYLRRQVALGQLRPGQRLVPIRDLARRLKLDPGTVARAYRDLEREGVLVSHGGGGSFVSRVPDKHLGERYRQRLDQVVDRAVLEALGLGFATEDIETAFTLRLADWRERRVQSGTRNVARSAAKEIRFRGSHDLAVELMASHFGMLYPDLKFSATFVGSLAGLVAVASCEADIAGAHLLDEKSGEFNIPFIRRLMPEGTVSVMTLVQRVQGLMTAPGNPRHIASIEDLAQPGVTFVNRQEGSGTRTLLDSWLLRSGIPSAAIKGYEREEKTHMAVASLIAQGKADVGLGAQSAASVTGLDFIPLARERYDLVALQETFERPHLRKLRKTVSSAAFKKMLDAIPGCDTSETGNVITVSPGSN